MYICQPYSPNSSHPCLISFSLLVISSQSCPDSSVGKESACNAGGPGSIPGSGRSPEEGIGYPLQYFGASLRAQMVKNPPAIEPAGDLGSIPSLGRSPGGGHDNPLQYSCLENPLGQRSLAGYSPWDRKESDTTERLSLTHSPTCMHTRAL